jgi:hypothetical protein
MPFKLIIEDDRVAAWSAINNTFTMQEQVDPRRLYDRVRHGMLIQVGSFQRWPDKFLMDRLKSIECKPGKAGVKLGKVEIVDPGLTWWINIKQGAGDPMTYEDLKKLRILPEQPQPTLHMFFAPYPGGITIWPAKGLTVRMEIKKLRKMTQQNFSCTFSLTGAVTVELWKNGVKAQDRKDVKEIRITSEDSKPEPGQNYNPPEYP